MGVDEALYPENGARTFPWDMTSPFVDFDTGNQVAFKFHKYWSLSIYVICILIYFR